MKIVVTVAAVDPSFGGPSRTVPALCAAMQRAGATVHVITVDEPDGQGAANYFEGAIAMTAVAASTSRYNSASWRKPFISALTQAVSAPSTVLYDVGLWLPSNHFAASMARQVGVPFVSSPRGMLSDRALQVARLKKRLAWWIYQKRDLRSAALLHATSAAEANDIRARGLSQPIAVVPNGIDLPPLIHDKAEPATKTVLYLSRIHPIKGLPNLIEAWAQVRPQGWRAVIAGGDEAGHQRELIELIRRHQLQNEFTFTGPVDDAAKWDLYRAADLFVLPSYSESFGMAIAEALAAPVPVITTKATPWQQIETANCGWWIETGAESLAAALREATSMPVQQLRDMGSRGRKLVETGYSWDSAARELLQAFDWIQRGGTAPSSIMR